MVSRFRRPAEVKRILQEFQEGKVEVLIGTHRILSRDVIPKDLGLVIVDEEQRFGVAQKELLRQLRLVVDVLDRELDRQGQAFYLHNRVESIDEAAEKLRQLVPRARVLVAHGQMP